MKVYLRPWWNVAEAAARAGWDVTVLDPDAPAPEVWTVGADVVNCGVISVFPCMALGWTVLVTECEPDHEEEP